MDTASGSIVTVPDGADGQNVRELIVNITPVQSGSGDPSPDNIRPISGWTGLTLSHSGADTSDPTTFSISWQTEAGTVYGGTLDIKTGLLTVTHTSLIDLGIFIWNKNANGQYYSSIVNTQGESDINGRFILCSAFKGGNAYDKTVNKSICYYGSRLWVYDSDLAYSGSEFKADMTGVKVTYKLATPITYQLMPTQINTLLGVNNIWADTGDIQSLKYPCDTKGYIDKKVAELQALVLDT